MRRHHDRFTVCADGRRACGGADVHSTKKLKPKRLKGDKQAVRIAHMCAPARINLQSSASIISSISIISASTTSAININSISISTTIIMKTKFLLPCLLGFLCAACTTPTDNSRTAVPANKTVNVVFNNPEKFTDLKSSSMDSEKDREYLLEQLKEYILERAPDRMADGQTLDITINDVDMAGDYEPWFGARVQDIRIIKDIYPPRIDLNFKLTDADGKVSAEGTRQLRDLNFMMGASSISSNDTLRHEKTLLNNWFSTEFSATNKK